MKSFASLFMTLVLTAGMLTGCGCTNRNADMTTPTTLLPTTEATTMPTTQATETGTAPTTEGTRGTEETINHGNGPLVDESTENTQDTTESAPQNRARQNTQIR